MLDLGAFDQTTDMSFTLARLVPLGKRLCQFVVMTTHLAHSLVKLLQTATDYLTNSGTRAFSSTSFSNHLLDLFESEA